MVDSPQLSPVASKGPLCLSPSFQMSNLSLPGQTPSPLQSPILSEVGSNARLEEEEEGRRKVHLLHANPSNNLPHNPKAQSTHSLTHSVPLINNGMGVFFWGGVLFVLFVFSVEGKLVLLKSFEFSF